MFLAFVILFVYIFLCWLVFSKFKWIKFSIAWGVVSTFVGLHVLIIFMLGLRFIAPYATQARMIQHTIQLTPRLPEPTMVTDVLVKPNVHVAKGTPLIQLDRRTYEYSLAQLEAQLAGAKQNVLILKADLTAATQKVIKLKSELEFYRYQFKLSKNLAKKGAGSEEDAQKWKSQVAAKEAGILEALAQEERVRLQYTVQINGVNTTVAALQSEVDQARFYLDNTLIVAPEDGYIINLQVRPGMVAGDIRFGAIASFICDADRYVLANFFQENLKYVKSGQVAELALDLYPGQIWTGKVEAIWQGSGAGQLLPSGRLPNFRYMPDEIPQGQFAVAIRLDEDNQTRFPIGTQGRASIYTNPDSGFVKLRKIGIRAYTWLNWLYPFSG